MFLDSKKATRKHARLRKCDPSENDQQEQPPEKQMKAEILCRSDEAKQNDKYHTLRDKVKRINESFLRDILYKNRQAIPENKDRVSKLTKV